MVTRLKRAERIQPHDVAIRMIDLGAVVIMRSDLVRRDVSVGDGLRVIVVRFVDVLWRKGRRQGEPGHHAPDDDDDHEAADWMRHARGLSLLPS